MIGYLGWIIAFCGLYLMADKKISGVWICLIADTFLIIDGIVHDHLSLIVACYGFVVMHIYILIKWKRDESS